MSRAGISHCTHNILTFYCVIIGFFLGVHYSIVIIRRECSQSESSFFPKPSIVRSNSFYNHFQYRTTQTCNNDSKNIFLTIAVLSSYERLFEFLPAMFESWLLSTTHEIEVIIFIEERYSDTEGLIKQLFLKLSKNIQSCVFIVKLKHVQNEYPPQKKSFYAMKFLYAYYRHRTSWILRLDDNAYANVKSLVDWLKSIDHREAWYIGQGGTGRKNESTIYFPPGKYFCMGGSGVILSQQTLTQFGPWLDYCFKSELRTNHEDVELGRCILLHVNISCTNAYDSKHLFYHHYGPHYSFGDDLTSSIMSRAFVLHPINNRVTYRQLYAFYLRTQEKKVQRTTWNNSNSENFVTFLSNAEFDLTGDAHYQMIDARWKAFIQETGQSHIEQLQRAWHQSSSNWTILHGKPLLGYHRVVPRIGLELLVELMLHVRTVANSPARLTFVRKRLNLRRPFVNKRQIEYREVTNLDSNDEINQLHLIVVSSNKDKALLRFIRCFEREILNDSYQREYFTLTILYFSRNTSLNDRIYQYSVRYPSFIRLKIVNETQYAYNRGLGRQLASSYFSDNQLLFFLDADMIMTKQSLINTRRLMIHQLSVWPCAVYFPIIFAFFSHKFTSDNIAKMNVESKFGLFSIYGFGNVAVRKRDLDRVGGWEINNHYWGVEDVNLFQRFLNRSVNCYMFRAAEPGLRHFYHKKMCNDIKDESRQKMCFYAEVSLFGSQNDMVNYLFDKNHSFFNEIR